MTKELRNTSKLKTKFTKGGKLQGMGKNTSVKYVGGRATKKGR